MSDSIIKLQINKSSNVTDVDNASQPKYLRLHSIEISDTECTVIVTHNDDLED